MCELTQRNILHTRVDATSYEDATTRILRWARAGLSRYVCATDVHGVIRADDDPALRRVWDGSSLNTPDGMPLVWALRLMGVRHARRVYGPDLTLHVCRAAAREGLPVALYGGTPERLDAFGATLERRFPGIRIVCRIAPPFRPLTDEEDRRYTRQIVDSGARIVLVGIGCPKQERWMHAHRGRIPAVMIGVGAAFDFHAGYVPQAPRWMQRSGLEWTFRLASEPRRLWRRYFYVVPRFLSRFGRQLGRHLLGQEGPPGGRTLPGGFPPAPQPA